MPLTVRQWLKSKEAQFLKQTPISELCSLWFFRNPLRHFKYNRKEILSPADGVLLYLTQAVKPNKALFEIKGKRYTVNEIVKDELQTSVYVAGIYLTSYSVHFIKAPYDIIILDVKRPEPIISNNITMIFFERELLEAERFNPDLMFYMFYNERVVIRFYIPLLDTIGYLVLTADTDVDESFVIAAQDELILKGTTIALVAWGSQVDLIIERRPHFILQPFEKPLTGLYYVRSKIDKLYDIVSSKIV